MEWHTNTETKRVAEVLDHHNKRTSVRLQVNQGLFKMYQVEVLSKMPIMQHSLWGSLMPFPG